MKIYFASIWVFICIIVVTGCYSYQGIPHDIKFIGSDGVELQGTMVFPQGLIKPVPGVVLLHGAEKATRSFVYRMHANIFIKLGVAVLLYDKRGAGESGGDYESTTYAQLIEDALGAIKFLRQQENIDPKQIGLVGASQSGWLTPEIAERSDDIAFIINKSGPSLSFMETVKWEYYTEFLSKDIDESSAKEQSEVIQRIWSYYLSPSNEERIALEEVLANWAKREDSQLPQTIGSVADVFMSKLKYDPTPFLERLTIPTLYVYGLKDINVPVQDSVQQLKKLASKGVPVTYHVFEEEGHELGSIGLFPPGYRFVDGYESLLGEFAKKNLSF